MCDYKTLMKNIESRLSADLLTLDLRLGVDEWVSGPPLLGMTFPKLRSLTLDPVFILESTQTIAFFERHPSLEFLKTFGQHWFSRDSVLPPGFLPNLKHLRVHFEFGTQYEILFFSNLTCRLIPTMSKFSLPS
jgi:hypothetical protein